MDEQLAANAKTLARWCYARGLDERLVGSGEQLRRAAVDRPSADRHRRSSSRRCGNRPPRCCGSVATGTAPTR